MTFSDRLPKPPLDGLDEKDTIELRKIYYQAQIDLVKLKYQALLEKDKAIQADEILQEQTVEKANSDHNRLLELAVYNAYLDVTKSNANRSIERAEFVQKAAVAVGTAYVAVIGLSFGAGNQNTILPLQGIVTTIFLGLSIFLASAYVAFIAKPKAEPGVVKGSTMPEYNREQLNVFIRWARSPALRRLYLLQAAVISLGIGIMFLPLAYLPENNLFAVALLILGLLITFTTPLIVYAVQWLMDLIN